MSLPKYELYIEGKTQPPSSGEYFESFDPYLGRPWAMVAKSSAADVEAAVEAADNPVAPDVPTSALSQSPLPLIVALSVSLLAILLIRRLRRR